MRSVGREFFSDIEIDPSDRDAGAWVVRNRCLTTPIFAQLRIVTRVTHAFILPDGGASLRGWRRFGRGQWAISVRANHRISRDGTQVASATEWSEIKENVEGPQASSAVVTGDCSWRRETVVMGRSEQSADDPSRAFECH